MSRKQEMTLGGIQLHKKAFESTNYRIIEENHAIIYLSIDQDFDHIHMKLYHHHS